MNCGANGVDKSARSEKNGSANPGRKGLTNIGGGGNAVQPGFMQPGYPQPMTGITGIIRGSGSGICIGGGAFQGLTPYEAQIASNSCSSICSYRTHDQEAQ
jgi:hypothetical protein